jgi:hypothetical protein
MPGYYLKIGEGRYLPFLPHLIKSLIILPFRSYWTTSLNNHNYIYNPSMRIGFKFKLLSRIKGIESLWGRDFPHPSRPALG